jgi:hypothetical protein
MWLAAASAIPLFACAGGGESPQFLSSALKTDPTAGFTHRVANAQVVLYWNCTRPEPGILRMEGVAQSPWAQQAIRFLEFELAGADDRDRYISSGSTTLPDILLRTNETSPFRLDLATVGSEVRFDLFYQYRFNDGDNRIFAGAPARISRLEAQALRRFIARDACSETQHRAR